MEEDKAFYCRDGKVATSLDELAGILSGMPQDEFSHHVNEYKNDFANWIEHVVKDGDLAQAMRKSTTRQEILLAINERIMRTGISQGLRTYTERREQVTREELPVPEEVHPLSQASQPPEQVILSLPEGQPNAQPGKPIVPPVAKAGQLPSREPDFKEHPYKYFTLREFILGVLLGFVLGFVVSKLLFSLMM